ncbi:MAG: type VI-A CRISPR-associated RNA-guided ribonuclease Cas13a, partial [Proteiniphilum sp.]|nr:type VI-A CRISPR-associated RNA-guided ribonuclease Cas13a [Proteiniphilum sp.]
MKISKVKVRVNKKEDRMVLIRRTQAKGSLVYDHETGRPAGTDETDNILPDQKRDSFILSIQNRTVPKERIIRNSLKKEDFDERFYYAMLRIIRIDRVEISKELAGASEEKINSYLNHRFKDKEFKYTRGNEEISFNLAKLIAESIRVGSVRPMKPYREWAEQYILTKSEKLKKSVKNNRIAIDNPEIAEDAGAAGFSPRKRALLEWEDEFLKNGGKINLDEMHSLYDTDGLAKSLKEVTYTLNDRGGIGNTNEYHRDLKKALQTHQRKIFGSSENRINRDNVRLYTYNLEIVKYLEHYFPIKKSKRSATQETIEYYLDAVRLKNTVRKQLENAVQANLLRQGKFEFHGGEDGRLGKGIDSSSLSEQKADEAFVLSLIGSCAFAANNIRNIVDPEQTDDILLEKKLEKSLQESRVNNDLFRFFYGFDIDDREITDDVFKAMREAVTGIRHNVVHYKARALEEIFSIGELHLPEIFRNRMKNELNNAGAALAGQLKTGGVLTCFPTDKLNHFLKNNEFELYRSVVPFAPGFRKVVRGGINYRNAEGNDTFYDLELSLYREKDSRKELWEARYFLLKIIYNNLFLPQFTSNRKEFENAVYYILRKNREQAQKSENRHAFAFNGIRRMDSNESITSYMAHIQSCLVLEKSRKKNTDKEESLNFEKFVLQVFIKGFDTFMMNNPTLDFVRAEFPEEQPEGTKQEKADRLNLREKEITKNIRLKTTTIQPDNTAHIAFHIFCKLLNASHLSALRNEIIKYRSARSTGNYTHLLAIIEL